MNLFLSELFEFFGGLISLLDFPIEPAIKPNSSDTNEQDFVEVRRKKGTNIFASDTCIVYIGADLGHGP